MIGEQWIEDWGVSAREAEVINESPGPNQIRLKNGLMFTFLAIPKDDAPRELVGQLNASGTGKVSVRLSTCVRPPSIKGQPFSHTISKEKPPFELSETSKEFKFQFNIAPYEQGYLYISAKGAAELRHVSVALAERK